MNSYETTVILNPVLSTEQNKETITKYKDMLTENGAEIVHENNWGMRRLAYPIKKKVNGFYHLIEFKAPGELIAKLETEYKRDERILRFLTVALDKHAVIYNDKKRKGISTKQAEKAVA